ncbi:hypothetical protein BO71DRAFT_403210, partial [Aspergillus ellipticus CBS 707.79]
MTNTLFRQANQPRDRSSGSSRPAVQGFVLLPYSVFCTYGGRSTIGMTVSMTVGIRSVRARSSPSCHLASISDFGGLAMPNGSSLVACPPGYDTILSDLGSLADSVPSFGGRLWGFDFPVATGGDSDTDSYPPPPPPPPPPPMSRLTRRVCWMGEAPGLL